MDRWHAVSLWLARGLSGTQPVCQTWLYLESDAFARQSDQVLRNDVRPEAAQCPRQSRGWHGRLLRLYAEARAAACPQTDQCASEPGSVTLRINRKSN